MKQSIAVLMILIIISFTTYSQTKNSNGDTEQKLMQFERDITKAYIAGDTKTINKSFADDYTGYENNYPVNKKMILKDVRPMTGVIVKDMKMDARIYGTSAVVNGVWEIKMGNRKPTYMTFMDILFQYKDGWKFVASTQNPIPVWRVRNLEDSEFEVVNAQSCAIESTLKSLNGDVTTFLRIKNSTSDNLTSYWINYSGQRDTSADQIYKIAPGKSLDRITYVTHPFIIIGSNGKCYGIYEATAKPSIGIIKE